MARDGHTAASVATEPNDTYDNLSLDERDAFDRIAAKGLKPVPAGRGWAAEPQQGNGEKIGPFPDLGQLEEAVNESGESAQSPESKPTDLKEAADKLARANGKVHKVSAKKPGNLSLADVAVFDQIKQLGYKALEEDGEWTAFEIDGENEIGPADNLSTLLSQVTDQLKDDTIVTLELDTEGQRYLDGMAPVVNKQLSDGIISQHEKKMARVEATAEETKANKRMEILGKLHSTLYTPDPNKPNTKVYKVGKIISRMAITEEVKFTTEEEKAEAA